MANGYQEIPPPAFAPQLAAGPPIYYSTQVDQYAPIGRPVVNNKVDYGSSRNERSDIYGYHSAGDDDVILKVKYRNQYREIATKKHISIQQLASDLTGHMCISQATAGVGTAYLLWLFFGWCGIHRWYLGKHNSYSWFLWFITGQLFGIGWLIDGLVLWKFVDNFNKRIPGADDQSRDLGLTGYLDDYTPNVFVAYLLWLFFGFMGIHRWYCHQHTPSSFLAWFITGQIFGLGWLWDFFHTYKMSKGNLRFRAPFVMKVQDKFNDYVPVFTTEQLHAAFGDAPNSMIRMAIYDSKSETTAFLLWFFFGLLGVHAWYLKPNITKGEILGRFCTGNYFVLGWFVEGILLQNMIEEGNVALVGTFNPANMSQLHWPTQHPSCYIHTAFAKEV